MAQERGIFSWSTSTWKRRVLLPPDSKYAGKQLAAGLLAVSSVSCRRSRQLWLAGWLAGWMDGWMDG